MSEEIHYEVLEIIKKPNVDNNRIKSTFIFQLALFNKEISIKTVAPHLYGRIIAGGLFKGDFIRITSEDKYIEYDVVEAGTPGNVVFQPKEPYLRFLCDTVIMPETTIPSLDVEMLNNASVSKHKYQSDIGEVITVDCYLSKKVILPIIGRVLYKTRINTYSFFKRNPYCFQIVIQGSRNLKVKFWGKTCKYHSDINKGDCIVIQEYRRKKTERNESYLVYNSFHEDLYLNLPEINVNSGKVYKVDLDAGLSLVELSTPINRTLEGRITYMSVLLRHRSKWEPYTDVYESVYEYFLVRIDDNMVILYSNSTKDFYDLEVGMNVKIENLRMYMRGTLSMYLSTIYTDIFILGKDEGEFVQGALGFIPDKGLRLNALEEEKTEVFQIGKRAREVTVIPLWKPEFISLEDLGKAVESLVINETRKYVLKAKLLGYSFANFSKKDNSVRNWTPSESFSVSYVKGSTVYEQRCAMVNVGDKYSEKTLFLFKNYFFTDDVLTERAGMCKTLDELAQKVGTWFNFVVDVFRASEDNVIVCLSQAL